MVTLILAQWLLHSPDAPPERGWGVAVEGERVVATGPHADLRRAYPQAAVVDAPMVLEDGYLLPPTRPGLGIDLNLDALKTMPYKAWHRRFIWRADGGLAYQ